MRNDDKPHALPTNSAIAERIARAYPKLTNALRGFADFVLREPFRAARMSIHEIVAEVGVSVATANRFAHALGFDGYPKFRAELIRGLDPALKRVERLQTGRRQRMSSADVIAASLQQDIENLQTTRQNLSPRACDRAVDMILRAKRIFVIGFGNGSYLSALLANSLDIYCGNAQSVVGASGGETVARRLFRFTRDDLVIAITFPLYMRDTILMVRQVKELGVPVVGITDGPTSPLVPLSDVALYARNERQFAPTSDASALALIEGIGAAVAYKVNHAVRSASKLTDFAMPWYFFDGDTAKAKKAR
jgi:DNA-binding MurR/RpiR family transcriptional regulator